MNEYEMKAIDAANECNARFNDLNEAFSLCEDAVKDLKEQIRLLAIRKSGAILEDENFSALAYRVSVKGLEVTGLTKTEYAILRNNSSTLLLMRYRCGCFSEVLRELDDRRKSAEHKLQDVMLLAKEEFGDLLK